MAFDLGRLPLPLVQAPMAGGPSTVRLAAAVCEAGGLGFLAAGYRPVDAVAAEIGELREHTAAPFGVNLFAPPGAAAPAAAITAYADTLRAEARRLGAEVGHGRHDDDGYADKLALAADQAVPVVSFTFGCPEAAVVDRLHAAGSAVWVTVTTPAEAGTAQEAGVDVLVVQGAEAGGHRGSFADDDTEPVGLLALLRLVARRTPLPLVACGGIMDGPGVAAVLCAGAAAAQLGSALMLTPEAGTSEPHRRALAGPTPTRLTRAFSGRRARGIVNRFMDVHDDQAPAAYPDVHHLTSPLRAAARRAGDAESINLWAGQAHALATSEPAGAVVRRIAADAAQAVASAGRRLPPTPS